MYSGAEVSSSVALNSSAVMLRNFCTVIFSECSTGMSEDGGGFSVFDEAGSAGIAGSGSVIVSEGFPMLCVGGRGVLNAPEAAMLAADMPMVGGVFSKGVAGIIRTDASTADMSMSNAPIPDMSIVESGFPNHVAVMSMSDASIADMSIVEWEFLNGVADVPMAGCVFANMGARVVVAIGDMELKEGGGYAASGNPCCGIVFVGYSGDWVEVPSPSVDAGAVLGNLPGADTVDPVCGVALAYEVRYTAPRTLC